MDYLALTCIQGGSPLHPLNTLEEKHQLLE